jgi:hypothetical protein
MVDVSKLQFYSEDVSDKIAMFSSNTDSSGSGIGIQGKMTAAAPSDPSQVATTIASIANPYGKKCLMTLSWSLDGISYFPQNQPAYYYNAGYSGYYWQALGFGGCSDSTIYFGVDSQYTASQTIYFQFALDSPT